jgi:hypothetical protein
LSSIFVEYQFTADVIVTREEALVAVVTHFASGDVDASKKRLWRAPRRKNWARQRLIWRR